MALEASFSGHEPLSVAARSRSRLFLVGYSLADLTNLPLEAQPIEKLDPQTCEEPHPCLQIVIGIAECADLRRLGARDRRGIFDTPVCGHRLSRPGWAGLFSGAAADGEDEIQRRGSGPGKLLPALAPKAFNRLAEISQYLERPRMHLTLGVTPGTERPGSALYRSGSERPRAMMLRAEFPVQRNRTL